MPEFIKTFDNQNKAIVDSATSCMDLTYFNLIKLGKGEVFNSALVDYESVWVVMHGNCDIKVDDIEFRHILLIQMGALK